MRRNVATLLPVCIAFAAVWVALVRGEDNGQPQLKPAKPVRDAQAAEPGGEDTRLALEDIRQLRGKRIPPQQITDMVAEQGRAFEVTADIARELRGLGFSVAQVGALKDASPDPLVPGKWLPSDEAKRDATLDAMRRVVARSGAAIQPVASRHITLWAAKDVQKTYLPDLQKAEKFFHTKCAEPIRSGLDNRSAHVLLLKDRAEFDAWWRAMLELFGQQYGVKDNPGLYAQFRQAIRTRPTYHEAAFSVICLAEVHPVWVHHNVAFSAGFQCVGQLATRLDTPLQIAFGNCAETAVCGFPSMMGSQMVYGRELASFTGPPEDWGLLVKQRIATRQATPSADLLKIDAATMSQPVYAERWALVGLLNEQPAKFGKLLLSLKDSDSDLAAIEKVYGWNEKELDRQWRAYVMKLGKKKAAAKRD